MHHCSCGAVFPRIRRHLLNYAVVLFSGKLAEVHRKPEGLPPPEIYGHPVIPDGHRFLRILGEMGPPRRTWISTDKALNSSHIKDLVCREENL